MCWETKKHIKPHVADKDLHVYKICLRYYNKGALPYYQTANEFYEEGKTYNADRLDKPFKLDVNCSFYVIYHGIHSYSCKCQLKQYDGIKHTVVCQYTHGNGFFGNYNAKKNILLVLCSIPKGTTYYVNEIGEYVSDSIKMDKFLVLTENSIDKLNKKLKEWDNE